MRKILLLRMPNNIFLIAFLIVPIVWENNHYHEMSKNDMINDLKFLRNGNEKIQSNKKEK